MKYVYVKDSPEKFSVNSIFCVGRNYIEHAAELNNPVPKSPLIFLKPSSSIIYDRESIELPAVSREVHHEVEVLVLIGREGKNIAREDAIAHIAGYGVGIDVTARDIQQQAKEKSHPWTIAKGFDTFAPVSRFVDPAQIPDPANISFELFINGSLRQKGNTREMIFPIPELISYLSTIFTLSPGDIIFTGTPQGVGKLHPGDELHAVLGEKMTTLSVSVRSPQSCQ